MPRKRKMASLAVALLVMAAMAVQAIPAWADELPIASPEELHRRDEVYFGLMLPTTAGLVPVTVLSLPDDLTPEMSALTRLIQSPPPGTPLRGMVPAGTEVISLTVEDGLATVDFSAELLQQSYGALGEAMLLGSIVNTLTRLSHIDRVWILVEGEAPGSLGGHIEITEPLAYSPYAVLRVDLSDIAEHWAEGYIQALFLTGIVSGYPEGDYRPERMVTREEYIKLLVLTAGIDPLTAGASTFEDVELSRWSSPHIEAAVQAGIVVPADYGATLGPAVNIRRLEMATLLVRAAGAEELAASLTEAELPYTDVEELPGWARGYVAAATELGLMRGFPDNTFGPHLETKRGEVATVFNRYLAFGDEQMRVVGPTAGETSHDRVLIWGVARAFEATVQVRVRDSAGETLAGTYLTATAGGPEWGIFGAVLPTPSEPGAFTVDAYELSAEDGSEINLVSRQMVRQAP